MFLYLLKDADHRIVDPDGKRKKKKFSECNTCDNYTRHISKTIEARSMYKAEKDREWEPNDVVISVDMQKVTMLPRLPELKQAIFCKRLVLFNETFASSGGEAKGKSIKPTGVLWHEPIKGRSAEDVASSFIFFFHAKIEISIILYEVNDTNGTTNEVTIKYFKPGHTFMSTDSFHHAIEQGMRKKQRTEDFQDFVDLVDFSGKALLMKHDDFLQIPRGVSS